MIKEKSSYSNDLPVNIRIVEIEEYPLHFHQDIEFVYVLKGVINLKLGYFTYRLTEGNVFTINGREVHGLYRAEQENLIALVQIDNYYFTHYFNHLSGSCFRTFTNDEDDERIDSLRRYFINILMESIKKEPGHKQQIIDLVIKLLSYLNEYFHYFSFENKVVVNTRNDNPVSVKRLGRLINYIYEKHTEKLTLADLSDREHLSTYHISHLFTEGTGMNFREFLCFARVEFSEMLLLDTNKKIHTIAQEVGFSATSYYIKYFRKWYGMSPEDYRNKYGHDTKAPNIPAKLNRVEPAAVLKILRRNLNALSAQQETHVSSASFPMEFQVDCHAPSLGLLSAAIVPQCKESVLNRQFDTIASVIGDLGIREIRVPASKKNEALFRRLEGAGIMARVELPDVVPERQCFGMDSMAALPYLLKLGLNPGCKEIGINSVTDSAEGSVLLKGENGIFTSGLVPKPAYFAYQMLRHARGELIHWGKYHAVVRRPENEKKQSSYCIICYHYNEEIESLCKRPSSIEETADKLERFQDSLDIGVRLSGIFGPHQIMIYRLDSSGSLLNFALKNGPDRRIDAEENRILSWAAAPRVELSSEALNGSMFLQISLKGIEAQCILITPVQTEEALKGGKNEAY